MSLVNIGCKEIKYLNFGDIITYYVDKEKKVLHVGMICLTPNYVTLQNLRTGMTILSAQSVLGLEKQLKEGTTCGFIFHEHYRGQETELCIKHMTTEHLITGEV